MIAKSSKRMPLTECFGALFVFSIIVFSYREGLTLVSQACGMLYLGAFAFEVMFMRKDFRFVFPIPLLFFLAFIMYSFLSLIWTNESLDFVATLLQLFLVSLVMINMINDQGHVRPITYGFLAGLLVASYNVWTELGGFSIQNEWDRLSSYMGNANVYAIALFIGIVLCMESLFRKPDPSRSRALLVLSKFGYLTCMLLFAYEIIFLAGSRKAMIAVFLFCFMYFVRLLTKVQFLLKVVILAIGAGAMTGLYFIMEKSVFFKRLSRAYEMLSGKSVHEGSLNERSSMITDGLSLWKQKPITGWGTDQFRYISGYQTYSHNNYVEILTNNGIIGLVLYYTMIFLLLIAGIRLLSSKNEKQKHYGWLTLTLVLIIVFWDFALVSYYSKLHWIMLSILMGFIGYSRRNVNESPAPASTPAQTRYA